MIKQGESLFIPFQNGEGVPDAHNKARTYKSIEACRKVIKRDFDKLEIVEYVPVKRGEWLWDGNRGTYCSSCKKVIPSVRYYSLEDEIMEEEIGETDYCPHCGALMIRKETMANENA